MHKLPPMEPILDRLLFGFGVSRGKSRQAPEDIT